MKLIIYPNHRAHGRLVMLRYHGVAMKYSSVPYEMMKNVRISDNACLVSRFYVVGAGTKRGEEMYLPAWFRAEAAHE